MKEVKEKEWSGAYSELYPDWSFERRLRHQTLLFNEELFRQILMVLTPFEKKVISNNLPIWLKKAVLKIAGLKIFIKKTKDGQEIRIKRYGKIKRTIKCIKYIKDKPQIITNGLNLNSVIINEAINYNYRKD